MLNRSRLSNLSTTEMPILLFFMLVFGAIKLNVSLPFAYLVAFDNYHLIVLFQIDRVSVVFSHIPSYSLDELVSAKNRMISQGRSDSKLYALVSDLAFLYRGKGKDIMCVSTWINHTL